MKTKSLKGKLVVSEGKPIKVGELVYRIYPSGRKIAGIAASITKVIDEKIPYRWHDPKLKFDAFFSLEHYTEEGGVKLYDGYGKGDYLYERIPAKDKKSYKPVLDTMKKISYISQP